MSQLNYELHLEWLRWHEGERGKKREESGVREKDEKKRKFVCDLLRHWNLVIFFLRSFVDDKRTYYVKRICMHMRMYITYAYTVNQMFA